MSWVQGFGRGMMLMNMSLGAKLRSGNNVLEGFGEEEEVGVFGLQKPGKLR